jgi:hypothetical protein
MPSSFRRGLDITVESLDVFRQHATLAALPALTLLTVGSAFAVSSSVARFFNAAVVHCASQVFDGEETSFVGSHTVTATVRTALYRYAATGERVGPSESRNPDAVFPEG